MSLQATTTAPKKVSLVHLYAPVSAIKKRGKDRVQPRVQPITVDDPWARDEAAVLRDPPRHAETVSETEREWIVREKKPIEVLGTARSVIHRMFSRHQIDKAMFRAATDYAARYEKAMSLRVKTVDPSAPVVSGGTGSDALDEVAEATRWLAGIERAMCKPRDRAGNDVVQGDVPVALLREILGEGATIGTAAMRRGDGGTRGADHWGWLFRKTLQKLAEVNGQAVKNAYANRQRAEKRIEDLRKRQERQDCERKQRGKRRSKVNV